MATPREIALAHYQAQLSLNSDIRSESESIWTRLARLGPRRFEQAWPEARDDLLVLLIAAQLAAAARSDEYIAEVAAGTTAAGAVAAGSLAATGSDGRPLPSHLDAALVATLTALAGGLATAQAFAGGLATLGMIITTQIADAGRVAESVAMTARRQDGYVRMLAGPTSCSRCVVLAGKWYEWNTGFERHPDCDCIHIPASEDRAGDLRTDPDAHFASLSREEQDRIFTIAGARAIRDGADIVQVVNARSGMRLAQIFGRNLQVTTAGTTRRGLAGSRLQGAPRIMPESIYRIAESQEHAIELLRRNAFII